MQGLIPKNENNGKLIGEEKVKKYYKDHQAEISEYGTSRNPILDLQIRVIYQMYEK